MFKLTTNDIEGQTSKITESLDELARKGARRMIAAALSWKPNNTFKPYVIYEMTKGTHW